MTKKGFQNFSMEWLAKNRPEQAKEIFQNKRQTATQVALSQSKTGESAEKGEGAPKAMKTTKYSKEKDFIEGLLISSKVRHEKEWKFMKDRKFRFDYVFWYNGENYAVEYEGIFAGKSRHTTLKGYTNDAIKYNFAVLHNYKVLRYTAKNYRDFGNHLNHILAT